MSISGYSCIPIGKRTNNDSYFFSKYFHCWGWASWRRAWSTYDKEIPVWTSRAKKSFLRVVHPGWLFRNYWMRNFDGVAAGKIDTWDFQMVFNIWNAEGLCCTPRANLVTNIGFGPDATHTKDAGHYNSNLTREELSLPLTHPGEIRRNLPMDRFVLKYGYRLTMPLFLGKKLNNSLSSLLSKLRKKSG
jgi:hypothetical protein